MDPFERGLLDTINEIKDAVVESVNNEKNPYPTIALGGVPARMPFGVLESDDAIYELNDIVEETIKRDSSSNPNLDFKKKDKLMTTLQVRGIEKYCGLNESESEDLFMKGPLPSNFYF